jgi:hypothetical protein|eukprot:COSAG03_NODE_115_length_12417_cov_9.898945_6_plen_53_part_00
MRAGGGIEHLHVVLLVLKVQTEPRAWFRDVQVQLAHAHVDLLIPAPRRALLN